MNIDISINEAMELLKDDINQINSNKHIHSNYLEKECNLKLRLYHHLCNKLQNNFDIIYLEHNPFSQYNQNKYHKNWIKCLENYGKDIDIPKFANHIYNNKLAKTGQYDISIFHKIGKNKFKFYYPIELKIIKSCTGETHKGYEDLYVLSDLIKRDTDNLGNVETYFFVYCYFNSNRNIKKINDMKKFITDIKKTYENAEINFNYCIYDKSMKANYLIQ